MRTLQSRSGSECRTLRAEFDAAVAAYHAAPLYLKRATVPRIHAAELAWERAGCRPVPGQLQLGQLGAIPNVPTNRHAEAFGTLAGVWPQAAMAAGLPPAAAHPRAMAGAQVLALALSGYGSRWRTMGQIGPPANNWGAPVFEGTCTSNVMALAVDDPVGGLCVPMYPDDAQGALAFVVELLKLPEFLPACASGHVEDLSEVVTTPLAPVDASDLLAASLAIAAALKAPIVWTSRDGGSAIPKVPGLPTPTLPGTPPGPPPGPGSATPPAVVDEGMGTAAKVGLALAGTAAVVGIAYVATRKPRRRR